MATTPASDHKAIQDWLTETKSSYVDFDFVGRNDKPHFQAILGQTDDIREAGTRLSEAIVLNEIGSDWAAENGSTGYVRFMPGQPPYLDAESHVKDWSYEREVDLDDIEYEIDQPSGMEP